MSPILSIHPAASQPLRADAILANDKYRDLLLIRLIDVGMAGLGIDYDN